MSDRISLVFTADTSSYESEVRKIITTMNTLNGVETKSIQLIEQFGKTAETKDISTLTAKVKALNAAGLEISQTYKQVGTELQKLSQTTSVKSPLPLTTGKNQIAAHLVGKDLESKIDRSKLEPSKTLVDYDKSVASIKALVSATKVGYAKIREIIASAEAGGTGKIPTELAAIHAKAMEIVALRGKLAEPFNAIVNSAHKANDAVSILQAQAARAKASTSGISLTPSVKSTPKELLDFSKAQNNLNAFVAKNNISKDNINKVWTDVANGSIVQYGGKLNSLRNILFALSTAHANTGAAAAKAGNAQVLAQAKVDASLASTLAKQQALIAAKLRTSSLPTQVSPISSHIELNNFIKAREQVTAFVAKNNIAASDVDTVWRNVASGGLKTYEGELKTLRNLLVRLQTTQVQAGNAASAAMDKANAPTARLSAALQDAAEKALKLQNALASARLNTSGVTVTPNANSTPKESRNLANLQEGLINLVAKHNLAKADIDRIWATVQSGSITGYKNELGKVETLLIKISAATANTGQTSRAALEKAHAEALKLNAAYNKILETKRNLAHADALQQNAKFNLSGVNLQARSGGAIEHQISFVDAKSKLHEFVVKNNISKQQIDQVWGNLAKGYIKDYGTQLNRLQDHLRALQAAHATTGKTIEDAGRKSVISWKSFERLIVSQAVSRALFAIANSFKEATKEALEFSKALASVTTVDTSNTNIDTWAEGLRKLSESSGLGVMDTTKAAYQALSNQVGEGTQNLGFLKTATDLAITGQSTMTQSVDLLSSAIKAYGYTISDAEELSAKFFKIVELGRVTIPEMADSLGRLLPIAAQAGVSIDEVGAAIATMTVKGLKWEVASTFMRSLLVKIAKPTEALTDLMAQNGFATAEAMVQTRGFGGFLEILQKSTRGSSTELAHLLKDIRAISGASIFSGTGLDDYKDALEKIGLASETYGEQVAKMQATIGIHWDQTSDKMKNSVMFDFATPALEQLDKLTDGFSSFSDIAVAAVEELRPVGVILADIIGGWALLLNASKEAVVFKITYKVLETYQDVASAGFDALLGDGAAKDVRLRLGFDVDAQSAQEASEKWNTYYDDLSAKAAKTETDIAKKTESSLKESLRPTREYLAARLKANYEAGEKLKGVEKSLADAIGATQETAISAQDVMLNHSKELLKETEANIKSLKDTALGTIHEIRALRLAESLQGKSGAQKTPILQENVKRLTGLRDNAFEKGNIEDAKKYSSELNKAYDALSKNVESSLKETSNILSEYQTAIASKKAEYDKAVLAAGKSVSREELANLRKIYSEKSALESEYLSAKAAVGRNPLDARKVIQETYGKSDTLKAAKLRDKVSSEAEKRVSENPLLKEINAERIASLESVAGLTKKAIEDQANKVQTIDDAYKILNQAADTRLATEDKIALSIERQAAAMKLLNSKVGETIRQQNEHKISTEQSSAVEAFGSGANADNQQARDRVIATSNQQKPIASDIQHAYQTLGEKGRGIDPDLVKRSIAPNQTDPAIMKEVIAKILAIKNIPDAAKQPVEKLRALQDKDVVGSVFKNLNEALESQQALNNKTVEFLSKLPDRQVIPNTTNQGPIATNSVDNVINLNLYTAEAVNKDNAAQVANILLPIIQQRLSYNKAVGAK